MRLGYGDKSFTMATPLNGRIGALLLRSVMAMARGNRDFAPLLRISSLHFAGIGLVEKVRDARGRLRRLARPNVLFLSLFDGSGAAYLADFSVLVPDYIDAIWGHCVRYPGARQAAALVAWLGNHSITAEEPSVEGGRTHYEFHAYRAEDGGGSAHGRRMAPMPLIEAAIELWLRLEQVEPGQRPSRTEILDWAAEVL